MTRILIEHSKHHTSYYDISDYDKWSAACMQILENRLDYFIVKWGDPPVYTEEESTKNRGESIEDFQKRVAATNARNVRDYADNDALYDEVKQLLEDGDYPVTIGKGTKREKAIPRSWQIVNERSDYEYEGVEIETPIDATKE